MDQRVDLLVQLLVVCTSRRARHYVDDAAHARLPGVDGSSRGRESTMKLYASFAWTLVRSRFMPTLPFLDESVISTRVWPTNIDVFAHANNATYFAWMDVARLDHAARTGLAGLWYKRGWGPVVSTERIRFRKPLRVLDSVELRTRVIGWESKYRYMQQQFHRRGQLTAEAIVKEVFLTAKGGSITVDEVLEAAGLRLESPRLSEEVRQWMDAGPKSDEGDAAAGRVDAAAAAAGGGAGAVRKQTRGAPSA